MTTNRDIVLEALQPGQIKTQKELVQETGIPKDTLSSLLKKMVDSGELYRFHGFGERGGYGYWQTIFEVNRR